jgi:nickel superoxide dismutase
MRHALATVPAIVCPSVAAPRAEAHCQLPCGVFDAAARFTAMLEDATTIAKAMSVITDEKSATNQVVRSVNVKDEHADKIAETVSYYFLAQRVKPAAADDVAGAAAYQQKLATAHAILMAAMKCKQTTDAANVETLRAAITAFQHAYMPAEHDHKH